MPLLRGNAHSFCYRRGNQKATGTSGTGKNNVTSYGGANCMKKLILSTLECPDGYEIAENVFNSGGSLIITKNTIVNESIRQKLVAFKVDRIAACEQTKMIDTANNPKADIIAFKRKYQKSVNSVKIIINDLAAGRGLDNEKINEISSSLYENMYSNIAVTECLNKIKIVDEYTYSHCINVSLYSMLLGKWLDLPESEIKLLMIAGILHDVGKSKIPIGILNKKGPLTQEEFEVIKMHPLYGFEIIKDNTGINKKVKDAVLMHHEKENGTGYPFGIKSVSISSFAKIISIADVFDALTSERVYKKRQTPFDTFREFERIGIGEGHYDPGILLKFIHNISQCYVGSRVMMSTGKFGEIVYVPPHNISNPVVRVDGSFIDLSAQRSMKIIEML
jgi:putative nucleotidyltransferase with HDIG domain